MVDAAGGAGGGESGSTALSPKDLITAGIGALAGGASTLITKLGVQELLNDRPFIGLAVFAIVAAFLIFSVGLMVKSRGRTLLAVTGVAVLLIGVGVGFGGISAAVGPEKFDVVLRARPKIEGVESIEVAGQRTVQLGWDKELSFTVERHQPIYLNLDRLDGYFRRELAATQGRCTKEVALTAGQKLDVGRGDPGV